MPLPVSGHEILEILGILEIRASARLPLLPETSNCGFGNKMPATSDIHSFFGRHREEKVTTPGILESLEILSILHK